MDTTPAMAMAAATAHHGNGNDDRIVDIDGSQPTQVPPIPFPMPSPSPSSLTSAAAPKKSRSRSRSLSPSQSPTPTPTSKKPNYIYAKSSRARSPTAQNIITRSTAPTTLTQTQPRSRSASPNSRSSAAPTPTPALIATSTSAAQSKLKQPTPVPASIIAANRSRSPSPSARASASASATAAAPTASASGNLKPKPPVLKSSASSGHFARPKSPTKRSSANGSASLIPHPDPALVNLPATTTAAPPMMIPPSLSYALAFSHAEDVPPLPPSSSPPPPIASADTRDPYAPISSAPTLAPPALPAPAPPPIVNPPSSQPKPQPHSPDQSQYSAHSPASQDSDYPSIDSSDPPTLLAQLHQQGLLLSAEPLGVHGLGLERGRAADAAGSGADISDPTAAHHPPLTPAQIIAHLTSSSHSPSRASSPARQLTLGTLFTRALAFGHRTGNWLLPAPAIADLMHQANANGTLDAAMDVGELGGVVAALQAPPGPPTVDEEQQQQQQRQGHRVGARPVTMSRPVAPGLNGARGRASARPVPNAQAPDFAWEMVAPTPTPAANADSDPDDMHLVRSNSPSPPPPPAPRPRPSVSTLPPSASAASRAYDLELHLDHARTSIADRDSRLRAQADTLARLQAKLDECQRALQAAEEREQAHVAEAGAYRGELARVQRVVGDHQADVERVRREADEREARWARAQGEVAAQRAQNAELRGLLNKSVERERELSGVVERAKRDVGRLVERCERLEAENEEMQVEFKNGEVERRAEVERVRAELEHARDEWRRERAERERVADKLKAAEARVGKADADAARLRAVANASLMDSGGRLLQSANSQPMRVESSDSIDHDAPEPLAHAPHPSRPPSPPPLGSLAAEFRMSTDADTSWAVVPNPNPDLGARDRSPSAASASTSAATDEMAVARDMTHAYEADLGKTKLALIASQERCLELEQLVDGLREQVARAQRDSKERLSVMGEALQDAQRDVAVARAEIERVSAEREAIEREWRGLQEVVRRVRRQDAEGGAGKGPETREIAVGPAVAADEPADENTVSQCTEASHAIDDAHLLTPLVSSPVPDLGLRMGKWHASLRAISAWSHRLMSVLGYLAVLTWAVAVAQNGIVVGDPHAVPAYMLDPNPDIEYVLRPYEVKCDGLVAGWVCRMLDWREGVEEPLG